MKFMAAEGFPRPHQQPCRPCRGLAIAQAQPPLARLEGQHAGHPVQPALTIGQLLTEQ